MAEMDEEISGKSCGGKVVDATRAVSHVAEDETVSGGSESGEYIGDDEGVHEETLGELEGDALGTRSANAPYALVDFKVVVLR